MTVRPDAIASAASWGVAVLVAAAADMVLPADVAASAGGDLADLAAAPPGTAAAAESFLVSLGGIVRTLARSGEGADAALLAALDEVPPAAGAAAASTAVRGYLLAGLALAVLRADYPARQDAQRARTSLAAAAEPVIEAAGDNLSADAAESLSDIAGAAVTQLSRIAADRAPLVSVETGVSLPSVVLAYRLYGDPERSTELVERNKVATPALMPVRFEAVAPVAGRR